MFMVGTQHIYILYRNSLLWLQSIARKHAGTNEKNEENVLVLGHNCNAFERSRSTNYYIHHSQPTILWHVRRV